MNRSLRPANEVPLVVVLLVSVAGLAAVALGYWRKGLLLVGCGLVAGALLRLVLPTRRAGLLAVRSKGLDVVMLGGLGLVVALLAALIPTP